MPDLIPSDPGIDEEAPRRSGSGSPDLLDLVREIQAGRAPEVHFQQIYENLCASVVHFFANRGFSDHEAEDLAQEVFVRIYRSIGTFRFEARFETWVFQIVGNTWKNALRSRATLKRQAESLPLEEVVDHEEEEYHEASREDSEDPLSQILADERTRVLHEALEKLPEKMRECVLLRVGQGLKYREIAAIMRISISTVKSQLNAANQRLKPLLERHAAIFID